MTNHAHHNRAVTLVWKTFDYGRLLMAPAVIGYFELVPGERFRHVRLTDYGMQITDLGLCTQARIEGCKQACEEHQRQMAGLVLA